MGIEGSNYIIRSVDHALRILEQFLEDDDEIGITEFSRRLNLHKNKIFRLLATLQSRNYVEQGKFPGSYRLGLKNLQLGQNFIHQMGLLRQARGVLESLVRKCDETSNVAILKGFEIIYLGAVESDLPVRVIPRVGTRLPFHCTAAGKVLAAGINGENLSKYIRAGRLKRYTPNTISDPDELTRQLRSVSELGYAVDDEELDLGVRCIGAPIRDYMGQVIGAVSVSGPSTRINADRIHQELIPLVKEAAEEISSRLGYH